jgi:hypothetical protein
LGGAEPLLAGFGASSERRSSKVSSVLFISVLFYLDLDPDLPDLALRFDLADLLSKLWPYSTVKWSPSTGFAYFLRVNLPRLKVDERE